MAALIGPTHVNNVRVKGSISVMNRRKSNPQSRDTARL